MTVPTAALCAAFLGLFGGRHAAPAPPQDLGPAREAGSAMGACLAAVIDGAPVSDMKRGGIAIHREGTPNLCIVRAANGEPQQLKAAVMRALAARSERFTAAHTRWDPGVFASRDAFCNAPGAARAFNVLVETGKPGAAVALSASVLETSGRDSRCDLDYGTQYAEPG